MQISEQMDRVKFSPSSYRKTFRQQARLQREAESSGGYSGRIVLAEGFKGFQRDVDPPEGESTGTGTTGRGTPGWNDRTALRAPGNSQIEMKTISIRGHQTLMEKAPRPYTRRCENRDLTESELALKNELLDAVEDTHKIVATLERQDRMHKALEVPEGETPRKPSPASRTTGRKSETAFPR